jgi:glycerol-3-phosphate dehydrogenase
LRAEFGNGFAYSDCAVDDARLVVASARAAADLGAEIRPRTACVAAECSDGLWQARLQSADGRESAAEARAIVNATGPWVAEFLANAIRRAPGFGVKLVKGSHIVVPRLHDGEHSCLLQNEDGRVVFACAYEGRYTLIGTTDVELRGAPGPCDASAEEVAYLCRAASRYFTRAIDPVDVVWNYCGVRPLFDDGSANPSAVSREYVLRVDAKDGAPPLLSVIGGKLTVYRHLAEKALAALAPWFPAMPAPWTRRAALPGGDLHGAAFTQFTEFEVQRDFPWLPAEVRRALARRHGALIYEVLGRSTKLSDLGEHFGVELYAREIDYFVEREWARTAEDVLWRRTKAGLHLDSTQRAAVARYVERLVS